MFTFLIIWEIIGIITAFLVITFDRNRGYSLTVKDSIILLICSFFGPLWTLVAIGHVMSETGFGDKVIWRGKHK